MLLMLIIGSTKLKILKELSKNPLHGYTLSKKLGITISSIYEHLRVRKRMSNYMHNR